MSAEVAVLCCIPLDEGEWLDRFASNVCGDFVRSNMDEKFKGKPHQAWHVFMDEAAFIQRKLAALASKHVEVVLRAESAHIRKAATRYESIVVIAHWKHERALPSDILSPALLWQHMLEVDPGLERLDVSASETPQFSEQLSSALDDLVLRGGSDLVAIPDGSGDGRLPASVLRRDVLNGIPYLAAGNRLETWDAMMSAEEFSDLFGNEFDGVALMAICHSTLLSEAFRTHHPNAMCICSRNPVRVGLTLAKFDAALMLMRAKHIPLWRALNEIGDIVDSLAG